MASAGFKGFLEEIDRIAVSALYNSRAVAAENVVKDLQRLGPAWTGKFSNSWQIETATASSGGTGAEGPPQPVKAPRVSGRDVNANLLGSPFKLKNTAPYADIACDLKVGEFRDPGTDAIKPIARGRRSGGLRGEPWPKGSGPSGSGPNRSTAELDWFVTYTEGGSLQKTVDRAMKKAEGDFK
jgi:hypothetical protein